MFNVSSCDLDARSLRDQSLMVCVWQSFSSKELFG
ncbi:unnamed protein product [Brassica rapa subsp. trilocularis]